MSWLCLYIYIMVVIFIIINIYWHYYFFCCIDGLFFFHGLCFLYFHICFKLYRWCYFPCNCNITVSIKLWERLATDSTCGRHPRQLCWILCIGLFTYPAQIANFTYLHTFRDTHNSLERLNELYCSSVSVYFYGVKRKINCQQCSCYVFT